MIENDAIAGINTDYGISTILGNFSDDFITDAIKTSLDYKFRLYWNRLPNYPEVLKSQLENIKLHSTGYDDIIQEREDDIMETIINVICEYYNLEVFEQIPVEELYALAYNMYQIFVSEFSDRMLYFFYTYIQNNQESLFQLIPQDKRIIKTSYARKLYSNQNLMILYDNMNIVIDALAGIDISMEDLLNYLADPQIAEFICRYIRDKGDLYKNYYASYITNDATKTDMMTNIRLKYVANTVENKAILNPETNPYIGKEEKKNAGNQLSEN